MNIFAYTAPGANYPPYISVNVDDDQYIEIIVRSVANPDGSCGNTSSIKLTKEQFDELVGRFRHE